MRTKTLLIGAAALTASVISSQAQGTVYSQNVVGYINQTVSANSYNEVANQLINGSDANQTNNNVNAVLSSGLISGNGPGYPGNTNTELLVFSGGGYSTYYYFNTDNAINFGCSPTSPGWYTGSGSALNIALPQGGSCYVFNPSGSALTLTLTGTVLQGTNALLTVPTGYSFLSLATPISTNVDAPGIGLPDSLLGSGNGPGYAGNTNDQYIYWNGAGYTTFYYFNTDNAINFGCAATSPGFYSGSGAACTTYPKAGQGFLFYHFGAPFTYTNTFVVQ